MHYLLPDPFIIAIVWLSVHAAAILRQNIDKEAGSAVTSRVQVLNALRPPGESPEAGNALEVALTSTSDAFCVNSDIAAVAFLR